VTIFERPRFKVANALAAKLRATELAIATHSVIIGLTCGALPSSDHTFVTLAVALCFHQFVEGIALGLMICRTNDISARERNSVVALFGAGCSGGLLIGSVLEVAGDGGGIIKGVLNAVGAGMLTVVGTEFVGKRSGEGVALMAAGAAAMAIIAYWN